MSAQQWFVGFQNDYPYVIDRAPKSSNDYPDHEADVALVAKPFEVRGSSPTEVARLIAAAPALLAALKALELLFTPYASDSTQKDWILKAREAIATATGEQP